MTQPTEVAGLAIHGDMAIDCGEATIKCGPAAVETNGYYVTIRDCGQNKTIFLSGEALLRFCENGRNLVGSRE